MKTFKKILAGLAILIALLLIIALFINNEYNVERQITINKPKQQVFDYIKNIKNQDYYSKWNMADPTKKTTFKGIDGTVGFVYGWDGNDDVGEGEQEIMAIEEGRSVKTELRFKRPMESTAHAYMDTETVYPDKTTVKWGMHGTSTYPMNLMNFMLDGMLGSDIETSLITLKSTLEKQ